MFSTSGGSYVFARNILQTKDAYCLSGLGSENDSEMSVPEMSDSGNILSHMCRSPNSDLPIFTKMGLINH